MNIEQNILILFVVSTSVFSQDDVNSSASDFEIICNRTKTCQQYDELSDEKYNDLRTRKCMCDDKCSQYGDCCDDYIYTNTTTTHHVSFHGTCQSTFLDGYIYMIDKCSPEFTNSKIIENCTTTNRLNLIKNPISNIPVTNTLKQITYKNVYCALCNYEKKFKFWQPVLYFEEEQSNTSDFKSKQISPQTILSRMKIDENRTELVSVVEGVSFRCNIVPNLPEQIISAVRFCLPESTDRLCSDCEQNDPSANGCVASSNISFKNIAVLNLRDSIFLNVDLCDEMLDKGIENKHLLCSRPNPEPDIESCFYYTVNNEPCVINTIYRLGEYRYTENNSVYIPEFDYSFPTEEYTNETTIPNAVYVCGTKKPSTTKSEFHSNLRSTLTRILLPCSIFFLILYLVLNITKKRKLRSLTNKILFSISLTLLLVYILFTISDFLKSCKIAAVFQHYLWLSLFTWLLIASYHFWISIVCHSPTSVRILDDKEHLKKYLIYCCIGWICPLSIVSIAVFFELAKNSIIPCNLKPGYGRLNQCFIAQYEAKNYFFLYPANVIFCCIMALFIRTSYHIYSIKKKNNNTNTVKDTKYYVLFVKLALAMGLSWCWGLLVTYTSSNIIRLVYVILNTSQGIMIFFAYGFESKWLNKIKNTLTSSKDNDEHVSSDSQVSNFVDPPTQELQNTLNSEV